MKRKMTGIVASDKMDKSIVVRVERRKTHPLYRKQYTASAKYNAHDEKNEAREGDKVEIEETKPISKSKTWTLVKVIEKAQ